MASAGCFLERRPLAASNLSRPPLSHPLEKEDNFHRDASPSMSIFPLHWIHTPSLFGMVNYPSFPYISAYIRVSSFWNLEHLWTNETGQREIDLMDLPLRYENSGFVYPCIFSFHTVNVRVYITMYSRLQKFLLQTKLNEIKRNLLIFDWIFEWIIGNRLFYIILFSCGYYLTKRNE